MQLQWQAVRAEDRRTCQPKDAVSIFEASYWMCLSQLWSGPRVKACNCVNMCSVSSCHIVSCNFLPQGQRVLWSLAP